MDPTHRQNGLNLALFKFKNNKLSEAAAVLKRTLLSHPCDQTILETLVAILHKDNGYSELFEALGAIQCSSPELFERLYQDLSFRRWRRENFLSFEGFFCSGCREKLP